MTIVHSLDIDFVQKTVPARMYAMQYDTNTRQADISLFASGQVWTPPEGSTYALSYRKSDGTKGYYNQLAEDVSAISVSGNKASVILAPQVLTAPGEVVAALVVSLSGTRLATFPFCVTVIPDPSAGTEESDDYYNVGGGELPPGGTEGQVLTINAAGAPVWADPSGTGGGLPTGGTAGQVLTISANGDAAWQSLPLYEGEVSEV